MNQSKLTSIRILVAAFFLYGSMTISTQAAGDLDLTFGNGGKIVTAISLHRNYARRVRVQPDGKIVTLGHSWGIGNFPFNFNGSFITRHNPNGSIDTGFGTNGVIAGYVFLEDFVILSNGKLMVTGYGESSFALYRYNSNGMTDTAFGNNGVVITQIGNVISNGQKIILQPDGKVVVFGSTYEAPYNGSLAVARYQADGTLDNSFAANGILRTSVPMYTFYEIIQNDTIMEFFGDAAIQPDGKLLVSVSNYTVSLLRLNADGTFDNTFGTNGIVFTSIYGYEDAPTGIALQTDGKILINGLSAFFGDIYYTAILRFNLNGTPDNSFGTNGKVTQSVSPTVSKGLGAALSIQRDGKILIAGTTGSVFALSRYNINGVIDNSFGTNGILTTPIGNTAGINTIFSLAFQPDGKLVAAGSVKNSDGSYNLGLVRYLPDAANRTLFDYDGDGRADLSVFRPSDRTWYLNRSQSGFSATQFGLATDKLTPADYDGDGKTDIAVFRDGFWYWLGSSNNQFNAVRFGQADDVPVPADFTGDGRAELAVFRSGTWHIFDLANNQLQSTQFGNASDKPVAADYDGDGKADIAVARQTGGTSTWYVLGSAQGFYGLQFGNDTDKLVPSDYDGDGKTDIAVFRSSEGNWYIRQSASGNFQTVNWGLATDALVPADYDGDGKADVAVFRGGIWYIRQTTGGINYAYFGSGGDAPTNQIQ